MRNRKALVQQRPHQVPRTFCDVTARFSEEDWKLLHVWQKDLYRNVMKEIQQAFSSLGPLIATSVFSLKPAEKMDPLPTDHQELSSSDPSSSYHNSQDVLKIEADVNSVLKGRFGAEEAESGAVPSHGYPESEDFLKTEAGVNSGMQGHCAAEGAESGSRPDRASPECGTDLPSLHIKSEPETIIIDHQYSDGREGHSNNSEGFPFHGVQVQPNVSDTYETERDGPILCINPGPEVTTLGINEDGEFYPIGIQDYVRRESANHPTGGGSMEIQEKVVESIQCTKSPSTYVSAFQGRTSRVLHSSYKGLRFRSQPRPQSYQELRAEKISPSQSGLCIAESSGGHQGKPRARISETERRSNINALLSSQHSLTPFACTQCNKSYSLKRQLLRHMKTHTAVSGYSCALCWKSFFQETQLLKHYKTHTGEKPHVCPLCHKRFSRKDILNGHIRIHSGEKPYKCTECEKSFPWKSNLNHHRRKHHLSRHDI
ncbi:zinc finger protein 777-like isoform X2 [Ambystoma mexicanum]|uniref:zinc finger protein 777-like isoform X2 n=1 Tax=Ambystoma mexicanum TaxID=8296 RepID=UPI0037E70A54